MIVGVIKTRDIILHPLAVFAIQGMRGFWRVLLGALSWRHYAFIEILSSNGMGKRG